MIDKEKLIQLKKLLDEGLITQEEFDLKKRQILGIEVPENESVAGAEEKPTGLEDSTSEQYENSDGVEALHNSSNSELRSKREALITKNTEYFIPKFESIDKGVGSWNWCGFFFAPMWFAYRKLYGWATAALFAPLAAGFIIGMILYSTSLDNAAIEDSLRLLGLVVNVFFAISANSAYKKRIDKLAKEMPEDEEEKNNFIKSKGGVSVVAMIAFIVIYFVIMIPLYS